MKKITQYTTLSALLLAGAVLLTGCNEEPATNAEETPAPENTTASAEAEYPLKVCVVSGESLGSMGEPVTLVHEGTTVKFCCESCVDDFKAEPEKFLAKLK